MFNIPEKLPGPTRKVIFSGELLNFAGGKSRICGDLFVS